jgi:hypothetical protein
MFVDQTILMLFRIFTSFSEKFRLFSGKCHVKIGGGGRFRQKQEAGENYIMRSLLICILHNTLLGCYQG